MTLRYTAIIDQDTATLASLGARAMQTNAHHKPPHWTPAVLTGALMAVAILVGYFAAQRDSSRDIAPAPPAPDVAPRPTAKYRPISRRTHRAPRRHQATAAQPTCPTRPADSANEPEAGGTVAARATSPPVAVADSPHPPDRAGPTAPTISRHTRRHSRRVTAARSSHMEHPQAAHTVDDPDNTDSTTPLAPPVSPGASDFPETADEPADTAVDETASAGPPRVGPYSDTPVGRVLQALSSSNASREGSIMVINTPKGQAARYWYKRLLDVIDQYPDDPETPSAILEAVVFLGAPADIYDRSLTQRLLRQAIEHPYVKPSEKVIMLDRLVKNDTLSPNRPNVRQTLDDIEALAEAIDNLPDDIRHRYDYMRYTIPLRKARLISLDESKRDPAEQLSPRMLGQPASAYYRQYLDLYNDLPPAVRERLGLPSEPYIFPQLARALVAEGKGEEAAALYRELRKHPANNMPVWGTILLEAQALDPDHGEVYLATLERYAQQYKDDPKVYRRLAHELGFWSGIHGDAEQCIYWLQPLLDSIEDGTRSASRNGRLGLLQSLAQAYGSSRVREYDKAIEYYQTIISDYPDALWIPVALNELARIYELLGDSDAAAVYRQQLLERYPESNQARELRKKQGVGSNPQNHQQRKEP